jgi:hypothetical protein
MEIPVSQPLPMDPANISTSQNELIGCPTFVYKKKFDKPVPLFDVSLQMLNTAVRDTYKALQDPKWKISPKELASATQAIIDSAQGILNELVDAQNVQKRAGKEVDPQLQKTLRERAKPYVLTEVMKAAASGIAMVNGKEMGALGEKSKVGDKIDKGVMLFSVQDIACIKQSFAYTENFEKEHQNRWRATFTAPGDSIGNTPVVSLKRGEEVSGEIANPDVVKRQEYEVLKLTKLVSLDSEGQQVKRKRSQSLPGHDSGSKKRGGRSI